MKINFLLIVLFWAITTGFAQNLVKNPSFEEHSCLPKEMSNFHCVNYWKSVKGVDLNFYYHADAPPRSEGLVWFKPPTFGGYLYQEPRTGDAIISICVSNLLQQSYYIVQGMLTESLKAGHKYHAELYVNLADDCPQTSSSFQICFSDSMFPSMVSMSYYHNLRPQVANSDTNFITDKVGWTKISGTFTASGGERFFALGNFKPKPILHGGAPEDSKFVYFFVDDVSVTEVRDSFIIEPDKPLVLNNIVFATGKAELLSASFAELDKLQTYLANNPAVKLENAGHTDNVGNAAANLSLSQNRAESVRKYLTDKGISPDHLTAKGYGDILPAAANDTPAGRAQNRRVEVKLLK